MRSIFKLAAAQHAFGPHAVSTVSADLAETLMAKAGDTVIVANAGRVADLARRAAPFREALDRFRWPVEQDWRFDRDEANQR